MPRYAWICALLTVLLHAPVLAAGFVSDDYVLLAGASHESPLANSPLSLWTFYDGVRSHTAQHVADGALPWWTEPTARHAFARPLASALFTATHALAGPHAGVYHAVSLLLCAYNVLIAGLLFRRLLPAFAAPFALLFFSVHALHYAPSLWVSALHVPLATALGMTGAWAHVRFRDGNFPAGRYLSVLAFALGLFAGEAGLSPLAYVLCFELASPDAPREGRARSLAPPALLAIGYVVLYRALHLGAHAIDGYLDPGEDLARFASAVGERLLHQLPRFVTASFEDILLDVGPRAPAIAAGIVAIATFAALAITLATRLALGRTAAWWLAAAVLAALPALAGPTDRALYAATIGSSAVLGLLVGQCVVLARGRETARVLVRVAAGCAAAVLVLAEGGLAGATCFDSARAMVSRSADERAAVGALSIAQPESTDVVVLVADDQPRGTWGGILYAFFTGHRARSWQALSLTPGPHRVARTAADAFELEPAADDGFSMYLYRSAADHPMHVGDRIPTPGLMIEVLDVRAGRPTRIRVRAEVSLDDPRWYFAARREGQLTRVRMPPVGTWAELL